VKEVLQQEWSGGLEESGPEIEVKDGATVELESIQYATPIHIVAPQAPAHLASGSDRIEWSTVTGAAWYNAAVFSVEHGEKGSTTYQNEQQYLKLETNHLSLAEIETQLQTYAGTLYGINVEARDKGNRLLSYTGPFQPFEFWVVRPKDGGK